MLDYSLGDEKLEIKTGYIYHIKEEFFNVINDKEIMINHENGHSRPTYFTIKDNNILWFIPLSSKVNKYKKEIDKKVKRFGTCKSIMISKIANKESAILIQNAFPTLEKYIDHPHIINGKPLKVIDTLKDEILNNFKYILYKKYNSNDDKYYKKIKPYIIFESKFPSKTFGE